MVILDHGQERKRPVLYTHKPIFNVAFIYNFFLAFIVTFKIELGKDTTDMRWLFGGLAVLCFPIPSLQEWLRKQVKMLIEATKGLVLIVIVITGIALVLWGGYKGLMWFGDVISPDKWTLMVCDEKLNDYECRSNSDVVPGFKSKNECLLEGARNFSEKGYECGSNCREDYGMLVCKELCNRRGCRK